MKKLFAMLVILSLLLPVMAIEEQNTVQENGDTLEVISPEDTSELFSESSEQNKLYTPDESLQSQYKSPTSKKKLAKKFVIAMLCVAGCSVFLYGTLTVYNKIRDGIVSSSIVPPEGEKPLEAPTDLTEAVKTFVDKTKWV